MTLTARLYTCNASLNTDWEPSPLGDDVNVRPKSGRKTNPSHSPFGKALCSCHFIAADEPFAQETPGLESSPLGEDAQRAEGVSLPHKVPERSEWERVDCRLPIISVIQNRDDPSARNDAVY